ncbi:MAG TPA: choice-of-anchor D domain-containing protein [Bryobacteraceae bacterium]
MSLNGRVWTPIGPSPLQAGVDVNGQVTSIAVNPNNTNVIYIGTAWGGIWRTRNGGTTWTPIFDRAPSLGIGEPAAIAIDPIDTSIIYAGTSSREGSQFSGNATQPGAGLFKSTDGGASWVRLGSLYPSNSPTNANIFFNQRINVVIVDPADNQTVYLASNSGFFRSTDGGLNWTPGATPGGAVNTLVLDPTSPASARILYAGIQGVGVVQSTNGGQNWTTIVNTATPAVATQLTAGGYTSFGKVVVALAPPTSPANPGGIRVIYASMVGNPNVFGNPDLVGLFLSQDQGNTWTAQAATGTSSTTYGGYAFHIAVDPDSPGDGIGDTIYFGTLAQLRSTDAGASFANLSNLHADTHTWGFAKQSASPSIVYCGNDGGIFMSTDGVNFSSLNAGGLQTGLFYNLDVKPDATASVTLGALQDNGVATTAGAVSPAWRAGLGGDGFDVAHDGQTATQAYARSNGNIFRSGNDGDSYAGITPPFAPPEQGTYLAAVAGDPSTGNAVYASGSQNLWQSTDGGATWPNHFPLPGPANGVDVAPTNGNNVAAAVGGQVFVSTDALAASGFTFTDITRDLPGRNVTRVAFDPTDPTTIYAVLSGFSGVPRGHVFRTTLAASTWKDISPPIDLPFNAVALDGNESPTAIYAGTDFGVLRSVDGGANWSVLDDIHFPGAPVFDLAYHNGELRAATFGRGVFSFVKPLGPSIALNLEDGLAFGTVCHGPQYLTLTVYNVGAQDLVITSVQRLMGSTDFTVLANPATPLVLPPGEDIQFTVAYSPTLAGVLQIATIRIISNDPTAPFVDLAAVATNGTAKLGTSIADSGFIGNACLGSFAETELTINNAGTCALTVSGISASSTEFLAPEISAPLLVGSGESTLVTIRFQPASFGAKTAIITLISNDPAGAHTVAVSGFAPAPRLSVATANTGNFGNCCLGSFKDDMLILNNSGRCTLTISNITSSSGEFLVPLVLSYPLKIEAGGDLEIPVRFQPTAFGPKSATITVASDDPSAPHMIDVSGNAPSGKIVITGSAYFGGVKCCHKVFRTIAVCNVGDCDLHVTKCGFEHKNRHWRLSHNPFPNTLHPGSCLDVVIRYRATECEPHPCELVIESDDPAKPKIEVEVIGWTRCCCKQCCAECREHRPCEERHKDCCEYHKRECCGEHRDECVTEHREERRECRPGRHHDEKCGGHHKDSDDCEEEGT